MNIPRLIVDPLPRFLLSTPHQRFTDNSKQSRESWAAIHRGTIHPFLEDEDYYQWKNWHRQLDKQDERRKHRKGFAFKAHSKELSYLFVDEMKTRAVFYWQKVCMDLATSQVFHDFILHVHL